MCLVIGFDSGNVEPLQIFWIGRSEIIYMRLYPIPWNLVNNLRVTAGVDIVPKKQISADGDLLRISILRSNYRYHK